MYILDTNSLRVFGNYYPHIFPSFWQHINGAVAAGQIGSVREVRKELEVQDSSEHLGAWVQATSHIFSSPTEEEMHMVAEILQVQHFRQLIGERQILRGHPVADPFLIARARACGGFVVTEEVLKPNAAKIPNVCQHFGVQCTNLQGFLTHLNLRY